MVEVDEQVLEDLYAWIDEVPLSRPKKDLKRDFSDGGKNIMLVFITVCNPKVLFLVHGDKSFSSPIVFKWQRLWLRLA